MSRINFYAILPFALLGLMIALCAIPAHAGGPPVLSVGAPSGQTSEWGQEFVPAAFWWIVAPNMVWETTPFSASYRPENTWPMIMKDGQAYSDISTHAQPSGIHAIVRVSPQDMRTTIPITVHLLQKYNEGVWSPQHLLMRNPAGELIADTTVQPNSEYVAWVDNPSAHADWTNRDYTLDFTPVPEPGSMVALLTGFVGLGGFVLRRR